MTREDIILMAKEQHADADKAFNAIKDGSMDFDDFWYGWLDNLKNMVFGEGYQFGAATEREECANYFESWADRMLGDTEKGQLQQQIWYEVAEAIRARGQL